MNILSRSTTPLDVSALATDLEARLAPFELRAQQIENKYLTWHHAELARPGSNISTDPPSQVTAALQRCQRERAEMALEFYRRIEGLIRAEIERRVDAMTERYETLASEMDALANFERGIARLASACGVFASGSVADDQINVANFQAWRTRAEKILRPPAPAPRTATMPSNPLPSFD
jgi:hypothetical protein